MTKGGRFLPGHDARFHAAQKTGHLADAIKHHSGANGTGSVAVEQVDTPTGPRKRTEGEEGRPVTSGTVVRPGMLVRAMIGGNPKEGVVYDVTQFGHIAAMQDDGSQFLGYVGGTWVLNTVKQTLTLAEKNRNVAMGGQPW
jgi:hypothetical protein